LNCLSGDVLSLDKVNFSCGKSNAVKRKNDWGWLKSNPKKMVMWGWSTWPGKKPQSPSERLHGLLENHQYFDAFSKSINTGFLSTSASNIDFFEMS
jgi:hypothetical protein